MRIKEETFEVEYSRREEPLYIALSILCDYVIMCSLFRCINFAKDVKNPSSDPGYGIP